jgi:predicted nicotinamide N-methyase
MLSRTVFKREFDVGDISVHIEQEGKVGIGGTVWDAAMVLARFLAVNQALIFQDVTRVLELGSGTGLCGIAVAMLRPEVEVVVTDQASHLNLIRQNVSLNPVSNVRVEELDWLNPSKLGHFDLIIGSDLVYSPELYAPLAETLSLTASPDSQIYICNEERVKTDLQFYKVAETKGWTFTRLPQDMLDKEYSIPDCALLKTHRLI